MGRRREIAVIAAAAALGACTSDTGRAEVPAAKSSEAAPAGAPAATPTAVAKTKRPPRVDPAALYDPPTIDAKPPERSGPRRSAPDFPDVTLMTHEGEEVDFYTDLVKGKIVVINFMFATCGGT